MYLLFCNVYLSNLFFSYMKKDDIDIDFNLIESYVEKKIYEDNNSWFPIYWDLDVIDEVSNDSADIIHEKIESSKDDF